MSEARKNKFWFVLSILMSTLYIGIWSIIWILDKMNYEKLELIISQLTRHDYFIAANHICFFLAICVPIIYGKKMQPSRAKRARHSAVAVIGFNVLLRFIF